EIEVGPKGLDVDHLRHQLEFTQRIGAQLLRTVPDYGRGPVPTESELTRTLTAVEPHCASAGVCLAIENATIPARVLEGALSRVASPWLGITLDTVNSLAVPEGTEQVVSALARHTRCLHVKDFSVDRIWHMMGFTVEGRPAGKGQLNVPWLLDQLRSAGADFNAILELWTPRQSSLAETIALEAAWADESISYLRKLIPA
ncbi:MAG TPA: TIM barrel protein, partial [Bryobacteraceae bacterium]|nr:TIM barrel protein [Bryobacteraceae bacterium]